MPREKHAAMQHHAVVFGTLPAPLERTTGPEAMSPDSIITAHEMHYNIRISSLQRAVLQGAPLELSAAAAGAWLHATWRPDRLIVASGDSLQLSSLQLDALSAAWS